MSLKYGCDVHDSREAIVTGLASIDIIIGVDRFVAQLAPQNLNSPVRNNFVGVHVGLGS